MLDTLRSWLDKPINVDIHIKAIEVSKEESYMHDNCIQDSDQTEVMETNFDYPNSVVEKLVDKPFVNYPAKTVTEQAAGVFFLSEILESSTSSLEQNTASAPTNQKKYPCELCDKHFLTKRSLKRHRKVKHSNIGVFICKLCSKVFSWPSGLTAHEKTHKSDNPDILKMKGGFFMTREPMSVINNTNQTNFSMGFGIYKTNLQCKFCDQHCINSLALEAHEASHSEVKTFACNICTKVLSSKSCLREHRFTHIGPKNECELCKKSFTLKRNLKRHKHIFHSSENILCKILRQKKPSELTRKLNSKKIVKYIESNSSTFDISEICINLKVNGSWEVDEFKCNQLTESDIIRILNTTSIR